MINVADLGQSPQDGFCERATRPRLPTSWSAGLRPGQGGWQTRAVTAVGMTAPGRRCCARGFALESATLGWNVAGIVVLALAAIADLPSNETGSAAAHWGGRLTPTITGERRKLPRFFGACT